MKKYKKLISEALHEIEEHPEILKEVLAETKDDLERVAEGIKLAVEIADLAKEFLSGMSGRKLSASNSVRTAASRIYERQKK
jgi:hypothetical protein